VSAESLAEEDTDETEGDPMRNGIPGGMHRGATSTAATMVELNAAELAASDDNANTGRGSP